jgi:hypothetical protein
MTFLTVSDKIWKQARLFFDENHLAKKYHPSRTGLYFIRFEEEIGTFAVLKNYLGEFKTDFIDLYLSDKGETYLNVSHENPDANMALINVLNKFNITFKTVNISNLSLLKLTFPLEWDPENGPKTFSKEFNEVYKQLLYKKQLKDLLITDNGSIEMRLKIYRSLFSVCSPLTLLKNCQTIIESEGSPDNVFKMILELEKLLSKMILIDRQTNLMQPLTDFIKKENRTFSEETSDSEWVICYKKMMQQLSGYLHGNKDKIISLDNQLSLSAQQAHSYNLKRDDLVRRALLAENGGVLDLDKVVKSDLADELDLSIIHSNAEQFAFALKNRSYQNYLNLLPGDFYHLSWSKNQKFPNSEGQSIKKIINDFNNLSNRITNDLVYALSYHHQANIMLFYSKTLSKLLEVGDFNNAHAIVAGMNHVSVSRLAYLKNLPEVKKIVEDAEVLFSPMYSMKNYRQAVQLAISQQKIVIPFLGLHLKELTFAEEGNPSLLDDATLNISKLEVLGDIFSHLDDSTAQLYRAKPLKTCFAIKKLDEVIFDEEKVYEASCQAFLKTIPDISKFDSIQELAQTLLVKKTLPLYLSFTYNQEIYTIPKLYIKLIDILEDKLKTKLLTKEETHIGLNMMNKLRLHASRNYMLTSDMGKRLDKLNGYCIEKVKLSDTSSESSDSSGSRFFRKSLKLT